MRCLLLVLILAIVGCSAFPEKPISSIDKGVGNTVSLLTQPSKGFLIVAPLIEMNSNFSSLLYDKTDADFRNYKLATYGYKLRNLSDKSFKYYVLPEKILKQNEVLYNDTVKIMLERIIIANKLGEIVNDYKKADFIIMTSFVESYEKVFGENSVDIEISVVDKDNRPIMFTRVTSVSKSDANFFYFPTKAAKPVKYLTVKGLEYLMNKSFGKVFLEG